MMKVRRFLYVFVGLLVFSGCSEEHIENYETIQPHERPHLFELSKNSLTAEYTEGFANINLKTDMAMTWTTACSADWLSVSPTSGTGGANIWVSWQENTEAADREATVTFSTPQRED